METSYIFCQSIPSKFFFTVTYHKENLQALRPLFDYPQAHPFLF